MSSHIILALYLRKKLIHLSSSMKVTWSILSICYSLSYLKCCWVKQDSGVRIQLLKKKKPKDNLVPFYTAKCLLCIIERQGVESSVKSISFTRQKLKILKCLNEYQWIGHLCISKDKILKDKNIFQSYTLNDQQLT